MFDTLSLPLPLLKTTALPFGVRSTGKVRDCYACDDKLIMVTTDRLSAFDRIVCHVPYKGQVLNLLTAWWYQETQDIIPNALINMPHPNVMIAKRVEVVPVEFVMRAYLTGSTNTAIWTQYKAGQRTFAGVRLRDDLVKNMPLPKPLLTPTTKSSTHDCPIEIEEIVARHLMTHEECEEAVAIIQALFARGEARARKRGFILVDSKFELGRDENGRLILIDEVLTPDSSRYWDLASYESRLAEGKEPDAYDKEQIRLWLAEQVDPYQANVLPEVPDALIRVLSSRYIYLYEQLTGQAFQRMSDGMDIHEDIKRCVVL